MTFARINSRHHTPVLAQIWVGTVAAVLATLVDVSHLSHILSVGCLVSSDPPQLLCKLAVLYKVPFNYSLMRCCLLGACEQFGYSVVSAAVLMLRIADAEAEDAHIISKRDGSSKWPEAVAGIAAFAIFSFLVGISYRYGHTVLGMVFFFLGLICVVPLFVRQVGALFTMPQCLVLCIVNLALNNLAFPYPGVQDTGNLRVPMGAHTTTRGYCLKRFLVCAGKCTFFLECSWLCLLKLADGTLVNIVLCSCSCTGKRGYDLWS